MAAFVLNNEPTFSLGRIYMNMMRNLSDATKLEIINLLSASILQKEEQKKQMASDAKVDLYNCFQGDWGKGKSTDEYCNELRHDLIPTKEIEL